MKKLLLFSALLTFAASASATTIGSENVTVDLESSRVDASIEVKELTSEEFTFIVSYPIEGLEARINGEPTECDVVSSPLQSEIRCETELRTDFNVKLNYTAAGLVETRNGKRVFIYSQSFFRPTENYRLTAILPEGFVLADGKNVSRPYSPSNGEISSDGQRISITWVSDPRLGGEGQLYQAVYERAAPGPDIAAFVAVAVAILLLGGAVYFGYIYFTREALESVYDDLDEDEVELLELVRENGGEMLQKDIVEQLDYSKAKISGLVSGLVDEDILSKQKEGRSNKLAISRKYRA